MQAPATAAAPANSKPCDNALACATDGHALAVATPHGWTQESSRRRGIRIVRSQADDVRWGGERGRTFDVKLSLESAYGDIIAPRDCGSNMRRLPDPVGLCDGRQTLCLWATYRLPQWATRLLHPMPVNRVAMRRWAGRAYAPISRLLSTNQDLRRPGWMGSQNLPFRLRIHLFVACGQRNRPTIMRACSLRLVYRDSPLKFMP